MLSSTVTLLPAPRPQHSGLRLSPQVQSLYYGRTDGHIPDVPAAYPNINIALILGSRATHSNFLRVREICQGYPEVL